MAIKDPIIGKVVKDYRFSERLGGGAFGAVYKAVHTRLQKEFAIKVLHPHIASDEGIVERFRREARSLAALNHPNIVQIVDFDFADEVGFYLILEWIKGEPLSKTLKREGPLPLKTVELLFSQLLSALSEAHEHGIVHRDLKPANLMITPVGKRQVLKILDFGIASLGDDDKGLTMTGTAMGSANYMSPEQALGNIREIDPRSDLYSCGIILGKCLTGKNVFTAESPTQILWKHIYEEAPPLLDLHPDGAFSPQIEQVYSQSLAKKKEERFDSALDFLEALQDAIAQADSNTPTPRSRAEVLSSGAVSADSSTSGSGLRVPTAGEDSASNSSNAPAAYSQPPPTGGFQSRPQTGGFQSRAQSGSFQSRVQSGGFQARAQTGAHPTAQRRSPTGNIATIGSRSRSGTGIRPTQINDANHGEISNPSFSASRIAPAGDFQKPRMEMGSLHRSSALRDGEHSWQKYAIIGGLVLVILVFGFFALKKRNARTDTGGTSSKSGENWDKIMQQVGDLRQPPPNQPRMQPVAPPRRRPDDRKVEPTPPRQTITPRRVKRRRRRRRTTPRAIVRRRAVVRRRIIRRRPAPTAKKYSITIKSSPSGASIYMNGRSTGQRTPATFGLFEGASARFELRKCKYEPRSFRWSANADMVKRMRLPPDIFGKFASKNASVCP